MGEEMKWARTREILAMLNNTSMGAKKRNMRGRDILPLNIDEQNPDVSEQEAADLFISLSKTS